MSTISATAHRGFNIYYIVAVAIAFVGILTFAIAPSMIPLKSSVASVTGNQNAYVDFLRGEKVIYANQSGVNNALSDYRAGEQTLYIYAVNSNDALEAYHAGEKAVVPNAESALVVYHQGEKKVK